MPTSCLPTPALCVSPRVKLGVWLGLVWAWLGAGGGTSRQPPTGSRKSLGHRTGATVATTKGTTRAAMGGVVWLGQGAWPPCTWARGIEAGGSLTRSSWAAAHPTLTLSYWGLWLRPRGHSCETPVCPGCGCRGGVAHTGGHHQLCLSSGNRGPRRRQRPGWGAGLRLFRFGLGVWGRGGGWERPADRSTGASLGWGPLLAGPPGDP